MEKEARVEQCQTENANDAIRQMRQNGAGMRGGDLSDLHDGSDGFGSTKELNA